MQWNVKRHAIAIGMTTSNNAYPTGIPTTTGIQKLVVIWQDHQWIATTYSKVNGITGRGNAYL